jgi:hypothetical protein
MALTVAQRRLRAQIEQVSAALKMDHWNIADYAPDDRTIRLQLTKHNLIRGNIVLKYALIDEYLTILIVNYFFRKPRRGETYSQLWRTKKFRVFNHYIMDEMYVLGKLRAVRSITNVPRDVRENIEKINAVRNAVAHSFFPENRRDYAKKRRVDCRESDVYSPEGFRKFQDDFNVIANWMDDQIHAA